MKKTKPTNFRLVIIAYLTFIMLGVPEGLLGVAWPSLRQGFGLPLDALGILLGATALGFLLISTTSGFLTAKMSVGLFLFWGSLFRFLGLLGYALAPSWWLLILVGLLTGMGSSALDAGLNIYFAGNHSPRLLNWLHAMFGVGAIIGPIFLTALFSIGLSWRWGYITVAVFQGIVVLGFALTHKRWQFNLEETTENEPRKAKLSQTLALPLVWLGIGIFFMYSGIEVTAGQWSYSLFTEARGISITTAGLWISIYWGSFTASRILFGFIANKVNISQLLRLNIIAVIAGAGLMWWNPVDIIGFFGLALLGFALAPIFPLLISETPRRMPNRHAANAIGFQVGAASVGIAVLPGLAGVLAENIGLEVVGPFLVISSFIMFVLHEGTLKLKK